MEWPLVVATFVLGIVLGYVIRTIFAKNHESNDKDEALEQTRLELSQHKQEVTDHFEDHYQQLAELTEQLNKVNKKWNEAANTLAPKNSLKPLATLTNDKTEHSKQQDQANELD
ncbi:ZapG family protein, partial [Pseudoalteromonas sp. GABNB9D]|uniref:ZapG family protein n=1 Tax=Pseudoalteromonas sp. GABNB9D TaxID=3025320 RepID=UPI002359FB6E